MKRAIIAGAAALLAMGQAFAADKPKADPPGPTGLDTKEASIPFLDQRSSILDWQANGTAGMWIEDAHKQWYYAEMFAPCSGLDFAVGVVFRNKILNRLDRDSQVIVPDEHMGPCTFRSLKKSDPPPVKHKGKKKDANAAAPDAATTDAKPTN
ncbi:MAG: DUF6491 family protein [Pseudomonadota bacterium]